MGLIETLHHGVDRIAQWPIVRGIVARQARDAFINNRDQNLFLGLYATWEDACVAAQGFGTLGFDNAGSAQLYDHRVRMDPHDYPSLYWLRRSAEEGLSGVFDVGGAIGIKYLAFKESLQRFPGLIWRVHDVPAMASRGRELATHRGDGAQLQFTSRFEDGEGLDVVFASGVLQYLPQTLGGLLSGYKRLPRRIVINTAAIHPQHDFYTVNSIGTAFCPYRVQTQATLVRGLTALGFRVRDSWINPDKPMLVPLHAEHSLRHYSGFCLERD